MSNSNFKDFNSMDYISLVSGPRITFQRA